MTDHLRFINTLTTDLHPVKRPVAPGPRTLRWIALALSAGGLLGLLVHRHSTDWSSPGAVWAVLEIVFAMTSGLLAGAMAFQLSIPGQKTWPWQALAAALTAWMLISLLGIIGAPHSLGHVGDGTYCYAFVLVSGAPMVALMLANLRRTRALQATKTLMFAGLSIACLSLSLLALCHPVRSNLLDLTMHLAAGGTLVFLTWLLGHRLIAVF